MSDHFSHPADLTNYVDSASLYVLNSGAETIWSRESPQVTATVLISGTMRLNGFKCKQTCTVGRLTLFGGGTAAAATPTLCRVGVFQKQINGTYSLVASSVNDTTLFNTATTAFTIPFSVPFVKQRGLDYLVGLLMVTGFALPNLYAPYTNVSIYTSNVLLPDPVRIATIQGLSDLPTTIGVGALGFAAAGAFHCLLSP